MCRSVLDRFSDAEPLLLAALDLFAEREAWVPWARAAMGLGNLHARLSDHQTALHWLAESWQAFEKAGITMDMALVDLYRVYSYLAVNLLPEALKLGEPIVQTFADLRMPRHEARALALLADVYARHQQLEAAQRELERAQQLFQQQGDPISAARVTLQLARVLRQQGQSAAALNLVSTARNTLSIESYPVQHAEANLLLAACCEDLGLLEQAQIAYRVAWVAGSHPTGTTEPPAFLAYRIAYARGVLAEAGGMLALARGEYERAVMYLERIAQGMGLDELRGSYLADKRPVYEAALRLSLSDGRLPDAFRIAELARAGALRDIVGNQVALSAQGASAYPPDLAKLKTQWAWHSSSLYHPGDLTTKDAVAATPPNALDEQTLIRELADLEQTLADAYRTQRIMNPRFAVLNQGAVLGVGEVQTYLDAQTALLAFDQLDDCLWVFVITTTAVHAMQLGALSTLRWEAAALHHALEEVRMFDDPTDIARLDAEMREALHTLYDIVFAAPLAHLTPTIRHLWIVPCDVLHALPLAALYDGHQYILERYSMAYLASASLLAALPKKPPITSEDRALIMVNSYGGTLPWAVEESAAIANTLRAQQNVASQTLNETQATSAALQERAGTAGLLHLIAHGTFRADAPLFSALHLADTPLTVNEIYTLDLAQTALVVLSGCQTGLGEGRGGELLSLAHAFYFAGASTLVVSRWHVDDAATAALMQAFYTALTQGVPVAEALRAAQLKLLAQHPHAYYWASFAVMGRGFDAIFENSSE